MQLRQAHALGVFDHHQGGVGHIYADFDDSSGDQDVQTACGKFCHDCGFFGGFFSVPLYTWLQTASSESFRAHAVAANNLINGVFMVSASILSAVLLMLFDSISLLYLIVAIGNIPLIVYLIQREPRFLNDMGKIFHNIGKR